MLSATRVFISALCSIAAITLAPLVLIPLSHLSKPKVRLLLMLLLGSALGALLREITRLGQKVIFHPGHWYYLAFFWLIGTAVWLLFVAIRKLYPDSQLEVFIGLGLHNLIRGYVVASSFMRSAHAGIVTSLGISVSALWTQVHFFNYLAPQETPHAFPLGHYLAVSAIMALSAWITIYAHQVELISAPFIRTAALIFFSYLCFRILQDLRKLELTARERILTSCTIVFGFLVSELG